MTKLMLNQLDERIKIKGGEKKKLLVQHMQKLEQLNTCIKKRCIQQYDETKFVNNRNILQNVISIILIFLLYFCFLNDSLSITHYRHIGNHFHTIICDNCNLKSDYQETCYACLCQLPWQQQWIWLQSAWKGCPCYWWYALQAVLFI